jgi:hypothetical protein
MFLKKNVTQNRSPNLPNRAPIFPEQEASQRQPKSSPELQKSGADFGSSSKHDFALQTSILSHFYNKVDSKSILVRYVVYAPT